MFLFNFPYIIQLFYWSDSFLIRQVFDWGILLSNQEEVKEKKLNDIYLGIPWFKRFIFSHLKATIHRFSKPNMFLFSSRICPPVLPWNSHWVGVYARLSGFHVTEHFDSIHLATLVRIDPIFAWRVTKREKGNSLQNSKVEPGSEDLLVYLVPSIEC